MRVGGVHKAQIYDVMIHGFLNVHTAYYSAARVFQMEGWEFLLKVKDSHWNYQDRTVITKAIYNCI